MSSGLAQSLASNFASGVEVCLPNTSEKCKQNCHWYAGSCADQECAIQLYCAGAYQKPAVWPEVRIKDCNVVKLL